MEPNILEPITEPIIKPETSPKIIPNPLPKEWIIETPKIYPPPKG